MFCSPSDIAFDASGNIYVINRQGHCIQKFAPAAATPAAFTANITTGVAPLTVQFTDASTDNPTAWSWSFGDGVTSTEQHPTHTYAIPGTYIVNLTISTATSSFTLSRPDYITVTAPRGDFKGDGRVDIGDVALVAYMVVGKEPADPAADFNENGAVDIGDAAKIAYYFVGKIPAL
jgi:PKD repeat protein